MKLYTGIGDRGETDLLEGGRTGKSSLRVEAYGTVEELNSTLGIARLHVEDRHISRIIFRIQEKLFVLGADLAAAQGKEFPRITEDDNKWLEKTIDELTPELEPLDRFVIPGASTASAHLHFCNAVCRRMERRIHALSLSEPVSEVAYVFSNRLSSLLFVLSLLVNRRLGIEEMEWVYKR